MPLFYTGLTDVNAPTSWQELPFSCCCRLATPERQLSLNTRTCEMSGRRPSSRAAAAYASSSAVRTPSAAIGASCPDPVPGPGLAASSTMRTPDAAAGGAEAASNLDPNPEASHPLPGPGLAAGGPRGESAARAQVRSTPDPGASTSSSAARARPAATSCAIHKGVWGRP